MRLFSDDFDPEGEEIHQQVAEQLLQENDWNDVYYETYTYMIRHCKTSKAIYNFCNLYYVYLFDEYIIPNPHDFVAYVIKIADLDNTWEQYGDFIDSFTSSIMERAGIVNLMNTPYYRTWEDPRVLERIKSI